MKIALVVPIDISGFLFCKELIRDLLDRSDGELIVIGDNFSDSKEYVQIIESWGAPFQRVAMTQHINPWRDIFYTYKLYQIFSKNNFDMVVTICTKPNIYGAIAARLAGVKRFVPAVFGRGTAYLDDPSFSRTILKKILDNLYRLSFSLSTRVWFTNPNDVKYFVDEGVVDSKKVILTRNYIDVEKYAPRTLAPNKKQTLMAELSLSDSDKVVICVGRMIWSKGIKEFVEAANILASDHSEIKFLLVGAEELTSPDAVPGEYLRSHSMSENFQWLGFRDDVLDLYAISDLAVLASYYREGGYPRALTEPMAMGKAVIAADTPDCRSPVEDGKNGYLVQAKNSGELAEKISTLLLDDILIKKFGDYSLDKARSEYDERLVVKEFTAELFSQIAD